MLIYLIFLPDCIVIFVMISTYQMFLDVIGGYWPVCIFNKKKFRKYIIN